MFGSGKSIQRPRLTPLAILEEGETTYTATPAPQPNIVTHDNHVYFYADVTPDRCLELLQRLREIDGRLAGERANRLPFQSPPVPIILHIQSYGGEAHAALAVADQLKGFNTQIISVIEGVAASAATILSMACHHRLITPNSLMLIHQFSGQLWGTFEQLADGMNYADMLMAILRGFYSQNSKMTIEQVTTALQRDSWFTAAEAVEFGLVDGILQHQTAVDVPQQPAPQPQPSKPTNGRKSNQRHNRR